MTGVLLGRCLGLPRYSRYMDPNDYRHQLVLRSLPRRVVPLLSQLAAPPRLIAHLILVHDVAVQLVDALQQLWSLEDWDRDAILFGAATHDCWMIALSVLQPTATGGWPGKHSFLYANTEPSIHSLRRS